MSTYLSLNPHFIYDKEIWGGGVQKKDRARTGNITNEVLEGSNGSNSKN